MSPGNKFFPGVVPWRGFLWNHTVGVCAAGWMVLGYGIAVRRYCPGFFFLLVVFLSSHTSWCSQYIGALNCKEEMLQEPPEVVDKLANKVTVGFEEVLVHLRALEAQILERRWLWPLSFLFMNKQITPHACGLKLPSEEFLEALGLGRRVLSGITDNKERAKGQMWVHEVTGQSCTHLLLSQALWLMWWSLSPRPVQWVYPAVVDESGHLVRAKFMWAPLRTFH